MEQAIVIKDLTKDYGVFRLDRVSFTVPGGSIVGLIGENGAGKSTTFQCILNLIPRDGGSITLLGQDSVANEQAVKEDIGVVLDESMFHGLLRPTDVGKILSKVYRRWDAPLFQRYLKKFDLPPNRCLKELSRGMKMKLCIAAALSHHPKLLLLDEATSGLDPVVRDELLEEFQAFLTDDDHAVLLSSHITSDLEKVADYIVYLHQGKVVLQGAKDDLLETLGRLVCRKSDLSSIDPDLLLGVREHQFGAEALVADRAAFARRYPNLPVDPVTLDEIMVLMGKGCSQ